MQYIYKLDDIKYLSFNKKLYRVYRQTLHGCMLPQRHAIRLAAKTSTTTDSVANWTKFGNFPTPHCDFKKKKNIFENK